MNNQNDTSSKDNILQTSFFQNELKHYGISGEGAGLIRNKDGVIVARVRRGEKTAVLKCFEKKEFCREIKNYEILQSCGVPTIAVLGKSDRSVLLEDISASDGYRLAEKQDLNDPAAVKAIAKWYKLLHTNGLEYVRKYGAGMYAEWDDFTVDRIEAVKERFGLAESKGLKIITGYFDIIRRKMDEAPMTLTYNDFYYTNMVVKKDLSEALMFDYNLLGKGCYASDVRNVTYWYSEENKKLFFSEYGKPDKELLFLDKISAPVITLCYAMKRNIFPNWAKEAIRDLDDISETTDFYKKLT
ncbi:MAG: hypothetical protein IJV00_03030 [Clostridia bacterium]|nr:hypothetical protein [Clostridia bacterium]